jgi:hypothetical protein
MRAAIAVLMTCALMLAPASAIAQSEADDRSYDLTVSDDRAEIQMPHKVDDRAAETGVVFDTREGQLSGSFAFAEADASEERLDVLLHQLVEFEDTNDDDALDDEDEVRSAWRLSNASRNVTMEANDTVEWRSMETVNVTSDDGVDGTTVQAVAEFPEQDPVAGVLGELGQGENRTVTFNVTVFDESAEIDGTQVPASHAHVDWTVDNFPHTAEDTQLALVAGALGTGELQVADGDNTTEIANRAAVDGYGIGVAAQIADQATVDDEASDVNASAVETDEAAEDAEEGEQVLALSYERGDTVEHELVLGASAASTDDGLVDAADDEVSAVPSVGAVAALGLLATAALVTKRR